MISLRRRAAPLLAGLATGAVLIGTVAAVGPPAVEPGTVDAALGTPLVTPVPVPTPAPLRRRTIVPFPLVPTTAPAPTTSPPTTTTTSTAPEPTPEPETEPQRRPSGGPAAQVVELTNAERADAGCDPLGTDDRLVAAAQGHAEDMAAQGYFDHVSRDGRRFDDRISAEGHPAPGGENIARGQRSAAEVVQAWMDSPGHRRNILDCGFATVGVGHAPDGDHWVQNFGR